MTDAGRNNAPSQRTFAFARESSVNEEVVRVVRCMKYIELT